MMLPNLNLSVINVKIVATKAATANGNAGMKNALNKPNVKSE